MPTFSGAGHRAAASTIARIARRMAKKPLKSQLNQIRAWAREGRTDAWIAHQLDVSASELRGFRNRHGLSADEETPADDDLRDEIEAEIEAATLAADEEEEELEDDFDDEDQDEDEDEDDEDSSDDRGGRRGESRDRGRGRDDGESKPKRRRRGRRRGGARRSGVEMEASFDHGAKDGYGLWLDPAIADDPVYDEHWSGHEAVSVTVEPDRIVIRRSGSGQD